MKYCMLVKDLKKTLEKYDDYATVEILAYDGTATLTIGDDTILEDDEKLSEYLFY